MSDLRGLSIYGRNVWFVSPLDQPDAPCFHRRGARGKTVCGRALPTYETIRVHLFHARLFAEPCRTCYGDPI